MGCTFLCALELFLLNILLYCGHALDLMMTFEPNQPTFFTQESVSFVCDMRERKDTDWYYTILKDGHEFIPTSTNKKFTVQPLNKSDSGEYECFGRHKDYPPLTSNKVSLNVSDRDVILEHPASVLYEGESVTLCCRHRSQRKQKSASFYQNGSLIETDAKQPSKNTANITIQLTDGGSYKCKFEDEESEPIKLQVESNPPKAQLRAEYLVGDNVTLTCSVNSPSPGWKYFWYKGIKSSNPLTREDVVFLSEEKISVSWGGPYWCRGGRGDPLYYTEYSDEFVNNRAVVTLQPSWPEIYTGETITLRCDIEDGGDIEWEYDWLPTPYRPTTHNQYIIRDVTPSHNGDYWCLGRIKSGTSTTKWSDAFTLKISNAGRPSSVLTVSPLWRSSGDSVTLKCDVKHPSAGWRYYWFKTVPTLPASYSYELLHGNTKGTAQDSYTDHRQTNTACYACRAGRGDPVYSSFFSPLKCVWSGDFDPAASLTVTPDRAQHFFTESVSLSCKGNSAQWRVTRFSEYGDWTYCTSRGTMTGSTCNMSPSIDGVYWCESETGQFSNAVNISAHDDIIMTSPAHPVAEGGSLTLGCKLKTETDLSVIDFYKNGKLIQNDTRRELTIPAVSKSDEGFYSCKGQDAQRSWTSKQSWVSVKCKYD